MHELSWYIEVGGSVTKTRFADWAVWHQSRALWRVLIHEGDNEWSVTGPPYRTKMEAMVELVRSAIEDQQQLSAQVTQARRNAEAPFYWLFADARPLPREGGLT